MKTYSVSIYDCASTHNPIEAEAVSRPATQIGKQAVDCVDQLEDSERRVAAIEESKIDLG